MENKLCFTLLFALLLIHVAVAQVPSHGGCPRGQSWRISSCQMRRIQAIRPNQRIEAEGGVTEIWERDNHEQLQCAGASVVRTTIRRNGLLLPSYSNAPRLTYVVQGQAIHSALVPGCAETYQSFQQPEGGQQFPAGQQDEHQKVRRLRQGDIVPSPPGMVQWFYNDGNSDLVLVTLFDSGNSMNQLDHQHRNFFLGGNPQGVRQSRELEQTRAAESNYNNILRDFDDQILQEVYGVNRDTVEKLKGRNDFRGHIILVRNGLQMVRPSIIEEETERREQPQNDNTTTINGLEETLCTARMRENIGDASRADIYNPQAGFISTVNRLNLPVLNLLRLSAESGSLRRNAIYAPHWNLNAHSIIYAIRGSARIQIVGNYQRPIFDGQLSEGQVLVVPQNFAVTKQAGNNGFRWIAFKTGNNAMTQPLAGKTSTLRGLPIDLLASMYNLGRQEAENLKYNRGQESILFASSSLSKCSTCPE